jgi:hypothetical protein
MTSWTIPKGTTAHPRIIVDGPGVIGGQDTTPRALSMTSAPRQRTRVRVNATSARRRAADPGRPDRTTLRPNAARVFARHPDRTTLRPNAARVFARHPALLWPFGRPADAEVALAAVTASTLRNPRNLPQGWVSRRVHARPNRVGPSQNVSMLYGTPHSRNGHREKQDDNVAAIKWRLGHARGSFLSSGRRMAVRQARRSRSRRPR